MFPIASILYTQLAAVAPIVSVSMPDLNNRAGWIVVYDVAATPAQKTAAQNIVNTFDVTAEPTRIATFISDPNFIAMQSQLKSATAAQIISFVDAQVPELSANARTMLKKIIIMLAASD